MCLQPVYHRSDTEGRIEFGYRVEAAVQLVHVHLGVQWAGRKLCLHFRGEDMTLLASAGQHR